MRKSLTELVVAAICLAGTTELNHGRTKVVQSAIYETSFLLVVNKQMMPQWVLQKAKIST